MDYREELCYEVGADPDTTMFLPEEYFDACIAGYDERGECFVYYQQDVIECLIAHQEMDYETAMGWFTHNIERSVGVGYPTYLQKLEEKTCHDKIKVVD